MILKVDVDSPNNTLDNSISYVLALSSMGFLSDATNWREDVDAGNPLNFSHFGREGVAEFTLEDAQGLFFRLTPALQPSAKIMIKTTITMLQEIQI